MNSNSAHDFQWSLMIKDGAVRIGITSKLQQISDLIENFDENAIIYSIWHGTIRKNGRNVQSKIARPESGDVIHFKFSPKLMKFSISVVCSIAGNSSQNN